MPPSQKVYVETSPIQGRGLFAARDLVRGEVILMMDDSRTVSPRSPLHPEAGEYDFHCTYLADGQVVLMQYPERHINHCCEPNSFVRTLIEARCLFALRDIASDEEITVDYRINANGKAEWACNCGKPRCRKTVKMDFFHLPPELQIEYLPLLDDWYIHAYRLQIEALLKKLLE